MLSTCRLSFQASVVMAYPKMGLASPVQFRNEREATAWAESVLKPPKSSHPVSSYLIKTFTLQRKVLDYLRKEEFEFPKIAESRKPFSAPKSKETVQIRYLDYMGEKRPAGRKVVITYDIQKSDLDEEARHKLRLLAGPRWDATSDVVKFSCEKYPIDRMNEKWLSDTLDRLLVEGKDKSDTFSDFPTDTRATDARLKRQMGSVKYNANRRKTVTLADFPQEWLPPKRVKHRKKVLESAPSATADSKSETIEPTEPLQTEATEAAAKTEDSYVKPKRAYVRKVKPGVLSADQLPVVATSSPVETVAGTGTILSSNLEDSYVKPKRAYVRKVKPGVLSADQLPVVATSSPVETVAGTGTINSSNLEENGELPGTVKVSAESKEPKKVKKTAKSKKIKDSPKEGSEKTDEST